MGQCRVEEPDILRFSVKPTSAQLDFMSPAGTATDSLSPVLENLNPNHHELHDPTVDLS